MMWWLERCIEADQRLTAIMRVTPVTLSNIGACLLDPQANIEEKRHTVACLRNPGS